MTKVSNSKQAPPKAQAPKDKNKADKTAKPGKAETASSPAKEKNQADGPKKAAKKDDEGAKQRSGEIGEAARADMGALPFEKGEAKPRTAETQALLDRTAKVFEGKDQARLEALAEAGTLDAPAKRGEPTLGAQLGRFLDGGGDPKFAADTIQAITEAGAARQCRDNTCAAATVEASWAKDNPSEYFRAATELATKGETTLRRGKNGTKEVKLQVDEPVAGLFSGKGEVKTKNKAWIAKHREGSAAVSATVQTALMNKAGAGAYDIAKDASVTPVTGFGAGLWTKGGGGTARTEAPARGVSTDEMAGLQDFIGGAVFGVKVTERMVGYYSPKMGGSGPRTDLHRDVEGELNDMRHALRDGARISTIVKLPEAEPKGQLAALFSRMQGRDAAPVSAHAVTVTGISDGDVTVEDPEGGPLTIALKTFRDWMEDVDVNAVANGGIGNLGTYSTSGTTTGVRRR